MTVYRQAGRVAVGDDRRAQVVDDEVRWAGGLLGGFVCHACASLVNVLHRVGFQRCDGRERVFGGRNVVFLDVLANKLAVVADLAVSHDDAAALAGLDNGYCGNSDHAESASLKIAL